MNANRAPVAAAVAGCSLIIAYLALVAAALAFAGGAVLGIAYIVLLLASLAFGIAEPTLGSAAALVALALVVVAAVAGLQGTAARARRF